MSRTVGTDHPPLSTVGQLMPFGPNHPPGQGTPNNVAAHALHPDPIVVSALGSMPAGLVLPRRWPRTVKQPVHGSASSSDIDAFEQLSSSLRSFLAAQELSAKVILTGGADFTLDVATLRIAAPPGGQALDTAVAATRAKRFRDGPSRVVEILAQDYSLELIFALSIGLGAWPGQLEAAPYTLELIDAVSWATAWPLYLSKYRLRVPRPEAVDPTIKPLIPTPLHASYPSGHATAGYAVAEVLAAVTGAPSGGDLDSALTGLAARIADNRECAGLHTAPDTAAGQMLGSGMGRWIVEMATTRQANYPILALLYAKASEEWHQDAAGGRV